LEIHRSFGEIFVIGRNFLMGRRSRIALLALMVVAMAPIAGCMSKAKKHLYKAEDLFEKRDLQGAKVELEAAIKEDAGLLDAHKSLAHVDEYLGDQEGAAREYDAASRLDPTDQKMMQKARYYRQMKELENSTDKALESIKAGQIEDGINTLRDILTQTKTKSAHEKAVAGLRKGASSIAQQGYALFQKKDYQGAINLYAQGLRCFIMIEEATGQSKLEPGADWLMRSINAAAKAGNTPDRPFKVLSDVVAVDPENKVANVELAQVYLARNPPDYGTAADLLERGGATDAQVKAMRSKAKRH